MNWRLGYKVSEKYSCFILNFGYENNLPIPQISLNLENDAKMNEYFKIMDIFVNEYQYKAQLRDPK